MARYPNRSQHIKVNGTQWGSPALRRNRFCFCHKRFQDEHVKLTSDRARRGTAIFVLPVLEDANSIQAALMQVMRLLISQQMDGPQDRSLLLYALQTASSNLRQTNFKPFRHDVVLDPRDVANTLLDAEMQYPKPKPPATQSAAVTPKGSAVVTPASSTKRLPTPNDQYRQSPPRDWRPRPQRILPRPARLHAAEKMNRHLPEHWVLQPWRYGNGSHK